MASAGMTGNHDKENGHDVDVEQVVLDAVEVYLLMKEEYRISRNIRASWFLKNINSIISVKEEKELRCSEEELEILSVIPKDPPTSQQTAGKHIQYRLLPTCHVTFFARRYRLVVVLDLSPSMTAVDIQSGSIHIAEIHAALTNFLKGITKPFCVPGSTILLSPSLYVTVIAYTPLAHLTTQQVLVQGCLLTPENVDVFLQSILTQLEDFENKIYNSTMRSQNPSASNLDAMDGWLTNGLDIVVGGDWRDSQQGGPASPTASTHHHPPSKVEMANPEATFVNMLWCGVLALQLLPENTSAGIVVISDGVGAVPDALTLSNLLGNLRTSTTACSFIQLGKGFYPHAGFGYVPHTEIMQFIATATFGAFLSRCPSMESCENHLMNQYHRAFLSWSFQKGLDGIKIDLIKGRQHQVISSESGWSESILPSFAVNKQGLCTIPLIRKKHTNYRLHTELGNVLSIRLREGYTIKDACITKSGTCIEVRLALPWKYNARIEYIATAPWPLDSSRHVTDIEIIMEGSYEFLHDITCPMKKGPQNHYRTKVVKNFWQTLQSLRETDLLLVHLQSFAANPIYYSLPEGTKGGMPLFYMPPNSTSPVLAQQSHPKHSGLDQFADFWKRIALMDSKRWQRWLHTHRIALLLLPDLPLPKHLHLPNSSGRYATIQYRVALKEVNSLLKKKSTFIMLDNHSYINLNFTESGGPPTSFYVIRVSTKTPIVLRLAFLGGTPGHERNKVVRELKNDLLALRMPRKKTPQYGYDKEQCTKTAAALKDPDSDGPPGSGNDSCVVLLSRPIEMILMRYEKMPSDFTDLKTSIEVTSTSVPVYMNSKAPSNNLNRLACYLHHRRWIWEAQSDSGIQIATKAVANILDVLTKLRLQQGFHVAYSTSGILSFVMELKMKNPLGSILDTKQPPEGTDQADADEATESDQCIEQTLSSNGQEVFPCLLQYIVFPPHSATSRRDRSTSVGDDDDDDDGDDQDTSEADGRLQLVTECWIEPQSGTIIDPPKQMKFLDGLNYQTIPRVMFPKDQRIISVLLNFEHLRVMCSSAIDGDMATMSKGERGFEGVALSETIQRMPYALDVMTLLPMCQQAQVMCSTFIVGTNGTESARSRLSFRYPKPNDILYTLLTDSMKTMTDFKLDLSEKESLLFAQSVLDRSKDNDAASPFGLSSADISSLLLDITDRSAEGVEKTPGSQDRPSTPLVEEQGKKVPQWTLYVNNVGKDHLILVFMPASYQDLELLSATKDDPEADLSMAPESDQVKPSRESRQSKNLDQTDSEDESPGRKTAPPGVEKKTATGLPLSILVYDCSLAALTNFLLERLDESSVTNIVKDLTFASMDAGAQVPTTPRNIPRQRTRGFSEQNDSFTPPSLDRKGSKALEWFCGKLANRVHKAFVIGLFKSLQYGQWVDCHDVQSAIEWVCEESLYEIDITEFVQVVCGHVYGVRAKVDAEQQVADKLQKRIKFADVDEEEAPEKPAPEKTFNQEIKSSIAGRKKSPSVMVPLELLATSPNRHCEVTKGLHAMVRERFTQVMGNHFKPVPSNRDIWFYRLGGEAEEDEEEEGKEEGDGQGDDDGGNDYRDVEDDDQVFAEIVYRTSEDLESEGLKPSPRFSGSQTPEVFSSENPSEVNSLADGDEDDHLDDFVNEMEDDHGRLDNNSLINSISYVYQKSEERSYELLPGAPSPRGSSEESVMGSEEEEQSPLFVMLVCSVKLKTNVGHRNVRTIPTCLGDLISCLESQPSEEINLNDLSVTLDLMCLSLPADLDYLPEAGDLDDEDTYRGVSFTEHSPPTSPHPDHQLLRANTLSTSDAGELVNDMMDFLGALPDGQRKAIDDTEKEVKWLLRDEIVSAMLHIKRVTVATLEMVAQHVEDSQDKPNCKAEELALQFVFGPEHSLAKFTSEFERLSIPKHQFCKVQDYWYLALDQLQAETLRKGQALKTALETYNNQLRQQGQDQTEKGDGSSKDDQGLIIPTTTIIYTPPSPEKHAVKRTGSKESQGEVQGEGMLSKEANEDTQVSAPKTENEASKSGSLADIEVGVDVTQDTEDVEDEATLEGATIVEDTAEIQTKAEKEEESKITSAIVEDVAKQQDGEGMKDEGEVEKEEVEEEALVKPRHADDNLSRSSGSSIQVLSEETLQEDATTLLISESSIQLGMDETDNVGFQRYHGDHKEGIDREDGESFTGDGSEGESTLCRTSTSFEVLTRIGDDDSIIGETEVELDTPTCTLPATPEHQIDSASTATASAAEDPTSPVAHLQSPSPPLTPSTPSSPPRPRVGSGAGPGKRPTHSRQGSGGVSSGPSSLFQSYVSHSGSTGDNDEEGYDASSSDIDHEESHLFVDAFNHSMPGFWLILKLCRDKVNLFFHTRERNESEMLVEQKDIYQQVSDAIRNTCRLVNQRLLLQELHNNKTCSTLLVAESDEDIWKQEDTETPSARGLSSDEDEDDYRQGGKGDYLAAQLWFNQGHFACDLVLSQDLPVHSRLKPSHRPGVPSRGLQALKTALAAFAVHDRKNLFVYRESSGEVFYLRLYESTVVSGHQHTSRLCSIAESNHTSSQPNSLPASQSVSRATSNQSLNTIGGPFNVEEDAVSMTTNSTVPPSMDSRRDSGVDVQSITSAATKASTLQGAQHIISIQVYGVTKAGPEIQHDLVGLLNKKLESATLDVIADMLARNPLCKLTPNDVQFIQPKCKPPTESYLFTIPMWAVQYLYSVRYYLRQNLLQNPFLHPPKYIDSKPDHHFQDCNSWKGGRPGPGAGPGTVLEPSEMDVFLYNRPHKAEGGTGTACVATSLVDGSGNPVVLVDCPTPSTSSQLSQEDFKNLINTQIYQPTQTKKPGPTALIQFFIWKRGSVDLAQQLQEAVEHALCDTLTEYCVLTAPMGHIPGDPLRPRREHQMTTPPLSPTLIVRPDPNRHMSSESRKKPMPSTASMKRSMSVGESPQFFGTDIKLLLKRMQKRSQSVTPGLITSGNAPPVDCTPPGPLGRARRLTDASSPQPSPASSRPHTPTKHKPIREYSPKETEGKTSWQIIEMERRIEEEAKEHRREAEEGRRGILHPMYSGLALQWFPFMEELETPSVKVLTARLSCRFSLGTFLQEFSEKLGRVCTDCTHKLYQANGLEFKPYEPPPSKIQESDLLHHCQPLPGSEETFILIGRNVHQWRYSLDSSSLDEPLQPPNLTNPKSQKSFQQFDPLDMTSLCNSERSGLPGLKHTSQSMRLVVPRQRLLLLHATNKQLKVFIYNWSNDKLSSVDKLFQRLVMWHNTRAHFLDCLVSQKMGLYHHYHFGSDQNDNPFSRSLEPIESLVKQPTLPSRDFSSRSLPASSRPTHLRRLHPALPPFDQSLQNTRIKRPLQGSPHKLLHDPVSRNAAQFGEICRNTRKELEVQKEVETLFKTWENLKRGPRSRQPVCKISDHMLDLLKQRSRLVHYCATPLLLDPHWRDHMNCNMAGGANMDPSQVKHTNEAPWHNDIKNTMVSQYKDFLKWQGFISVHTSQTHSRQGSKLLHARGSSEQHSRRLSLKRPSESGVEGHLQITSPGGIILIELSFKHIYFCVKLYAFESSRIPSGKTINKELATLFTDDCDKYKDLIHLHSSAYDFHLRTIQSYLFNPDMGFQSHYHVSSFLGSFMKYYSMPPQFRQNYIKKDTIQFLSLNTPAPQLYEYLVSHPPPNWRKLVMVLPTSSTGTPEAAGFPSDREELHHALCRIHGSVHPLLQDRQSNRFPDDVSVVVAWDEAEYRCQTRPNSPAVGASGSSSAEGTAVYHKNMLQLEFYVIVTNRKDIYPQKTVKPVRADDSFLPKSAFLQRCKLGETEAIAERERILAMLTSADINCRRDSLWDQLLMWDMEDMDSMATASTKKGKKRDSAEEEESQTMPYPEFKVLLGCVHHTPLTIMDPSLKPLLGNSVGWYTELFRALRASRYPIITRYITSEDGNAKHLVLLLADSCNQVVLFTIDENTAELEMISKERPTMVPDGDGNMTIILDIETQKYIENIINAIGFHLWTTVF
ncbi:KICSTOR complex protein SZT2-like isoform X2 [Lytechinus pictus]|uniref:KICSTOR complex protein SZT2-like isoform X2 n=1 Tax=Lytechinus pictus TaxID=7653 RepID=UPI0030B9B511